MKPILSKEEKSHMEVGGGTEYSSSEVEYNNCIAQQVVKSENHPSRTKKNTRG